MHDLHRSHNTPDTTPNKKKLISRVPDTFDRTRIRSVCWGPKRKSPRCPVLKSIPSKCFQSSNRKRGKRGRTLSVSVDPGLQVLFLATENMLFFDPVPLENLWFSPSAPHWFYNSETFSSVIAPRGKKGGDEFFERLHKPTTSRLNRLIKFASELFFACDGGGVCNCAGSAVVNTRFNNCHWQMYPFTGTTAVLGENWILHRH
jgi:hypothetical protein